jgi:adenine-specific DNA-methyltransferase
MADFCEVEISPDFWWVGKSLADSKNSKTTNSICNESHKPCIDKDFKKLFPKRDMKGRRYSTIPIRAPGETENANSSKPFKGILSPAGRYWRTDVATLE